MVSRAPSADRHGSRSLGRPAPLGNPPKHLRRRSAAALARVGAHRAMVAARRIAWCSKSYVQLMAEARADFAEMTASRLALLSRQASRPGIVDRSHPAHAAARAQGEQALTPGTRAGAA